MDANDQVSQEAPNLDELKAQVSAQPDKLLPLRELGWALYGEYQTEEAVKRLEQAVQRFPEDSESHYALGLAYKRAGAMDKARQAFRQAVDNSDNDPDSVRSTMMLRLAKRQLNQVEHGTWDLTE